MIPLQIFWETQVTTKPALWYLHIFCNIPFHVQIRLFIFFSTFKIQLVFQSVALPYLRNDRCSMYLLRGDTCKEVVLSDFFIFQSLMRSPRCQSLVKVFNDEKTYQQWMKDVSGVTWDNLTQTRLRNQHRFIWSYWEGWLASYWGMSLQDHSLWSLLGFGDQGRSLNAWRETNVILAFKKGQKDNSGWISQSTSLCSLGKSWKKSSWTCLWTPEKEKGDWK